MIAVTAASGKLGGLVLEGLLKASSPTGFALIPRR